MGNGPKRVKERVKDHQSAGRMYGAQSRASHTQILKSKNIGVVEGRNARLRVQRLVFSLSLRLLVFVSLLCVLPFLFVKV